MVVAIAKWCRQQIIEMPGGFWQSRLYLLNEVL